MVAALPSYLLVTVGFAGLDRVDDIGVSEVKGDAKVCSNFYVTYKDMKE